MTSIDEYYCFEDDKLSLILPDIQKLKNWKWKELYQQITLIV